MHIRYFNSRAHVERDWSIISSSNPSLPAFQLTRSRGARRNRQGAGERGEKISTHALTWSATGTSSGSSSRDMAFQLTRSRGARPARTSLAVFSVPHFNSRAHVERDAINIFNFEQWCISTHALTWSATLTPPLRLPLWSHFNSRAHVERDPRCCCSRALAPHDTDPILFGLQNIGAMFINR